MVGDVGRDPPHVDRANNGRFESTRNARRGFPSRLCRHLESVTPFQDFRLIVFRHPARCPGLSCLGPFRASRRDASDVTRRGQLVYNNEGVVLAFHVAAPLWRSAIAREQVWANHSPVSTSARTTFPAENRRRTFFACGPWAASAIRQGASREFRMFRWTGPLLQGLVQ